MAQMFMENILTYLFIPYAVPLFAQKLLLINNVLIFKGKDQQTVSGPAYQACQGTGVGAALMTEALKAVDRDGLIVYLESSNPRNISLYVRHGFDGNISNALDE